MDTATLPLELRSIRKLREQGPGLFIAATYDELITWNLASRRFKKSAAATPANLR